MTLRSLLLSGLDGANPLGFLAALGTLVTLYRAGEPGVRLRWQRAHTWVPVLDGLAAADEEAVSRKLAEALKGRCVPGEGENQLRELQRQMDDARRLLKQKRKEIKERGLSRSEQRRTLDEELRPLEVAAHEARRRWLAARRDAVPAPELALGKRIEDAERTDYRGLVQGLLEAGDPESLAALELLAAFGSDVCIDDQGRMEATLFEFTKGSGNQFFLETVRQLMVLSGAERVRRVLFQPWDFRDEKWSLRWDPSEDRRYALLDRDPTDNDNKPRTVWMANLLAYRGLALFPAAPTRRGLAVTSWSGGGGTPAFTWPLWEFSADPDTVRTMVQMGELVRERPDAARLRARGIAAVYRSQRVRVGSGGKEKLNFSPARQLV